VHLGESDLPGDLGLGLIAEEPQQQNAPLPLRQRRDQRPETLAVLDEIELRLGLRERSREAGPATRVAAPAVVPCRFV